MKKNKSRTEQLVWNVYQNTSLSRRKWQKAILVQILIRLIYGSAVLHLRGTVLSRAGTYDRRERVSATASTASMMDW
jgi:hypothetical protein